MNVGQVRSRLEVDKSFAKFMLEALFALDFPLQSDVLNVIAGIDQILSKSGQLWLQHLDGLEDTQQILLTGQKCRIFCMMFNTRLQLRHAFALTEARCKSFDLSKSVAANASKPAIRKHAKELAWEDWIDADINSTETAHVAIQKVTYICLELVD